MSLKEWRIEMQKCLLDIELIEDITWAKIAILPSPIINKIENLFRDFKQLKEQ